MAIPAEFTAEIEQAATVAGQTAASNAKDEGGGTGETAFVQNPEEEKNDGGNPNVAGESGGSDPGAGEGGQAGTEGEGNVGTSAEGSVDDAGGGGTDGDAGNAGDGGTSHANQGGVSSATLARAIRAGLRIDEALALGSDAKVNEIADSMEADRVAQLEAEQAEADAEAEQERINEERKKLNESFPTLDPDETDPKVIEAFNKMQERFVKQQEQLDAFQQQQVQQSQVAEAAQQRELAKWFGDQLGDLNKTFKESLGKDVWEDVSLDSAKGDLIASKMAALVGSYTSMGQKAPSREEIFADAARLVLKDDFVRAEEARLAKQVEKRKEMEINPPGGSKGKTEKSPVDATADLINKRFFNR